MTWLIILSIYLGGLLFTVFLMGFVIGQTPDPDLQVILFGALAWPMTLILIIVLVLFWTVVWFYDTGSIIRGRFEKQEDGEK